MKLGTLYGIGIGPGDPGLITVKGKEILGRCPDVFAPKARIKSESVALAIAREHLHPQAVVREVVFPMVQDRQTLEQHWKKSAAQVAEVLSAGRDACFLTLGDTLLYSTHIYLVRSLKALLPGAPVITVPGITAFSAAAALTGFPVGEGKSPVVIVPSDDTPELLLRAIELKGTVVLMKVGKRLQSVLELLRERSLLGRSVFVARAGLDGERIETDLGNLQVSDPHLGYLSTIIVDARKEP